MNRVVYAGMMVGAFVCLAAPAQAQSEDAKEFVLPSGIIPDELFGVPCEFEPAEGNFPASIRCAAENPIEKPSFGIVSMDSDCESSSAEMMEHRRTQANDGSPFFEVMTESEFTPASVPEGQGYTAFYRVQMGGRWFWETCGSGRLTKVLAVMFSDTKVFAMKFEVEEKIFGVPRPDAQQAGELEQ